MNIRYSGKRAQLQNNNNLMQDEAAAQHRVRMHRAMADHQHPFYVNGERIDEVRYWLKKLFSLVCLQKIFGIAGLVDPATYVRSKIRGNTVVPLFQNSSTVGEKIDKVSSGVSRALR